ncbi:MAG: hypothetical protein ABL925_18410, partial [Methylococcales bacterium]
AQGERNLDGSTALFKIMPLRLPKGETVTSVLARCTGFINCLAVTAAGYFTWLIVASDSDMLPILTWALDNNYAIKVL